MRTVLITAFEPFGQDTENAAALVCEHLLDSGPGYRVLKRIRPVEFVAAREALLSYMDEIRPDLVLCLGQAAGRSEITPERTAVNLMDAKIPDNAGWMPDEVPIFLEGPAAYFTNVPVKSVVQAAREAGYPAALSNSAGTYVCNCVFYSLMNRIAYTPSNEATPPLWGDFIHIPYIKEQKGVENAPLSLKQATETVRFLLEAIIKQMDSHNQFF